LHPELASLHPTGQIDLSLASQQRNRAHLPQIYADRVVGVDRLLNGLRMKVLSLARFLGTKKPRILVERNSKRPVIVAYELVFKLIH
jgi:hypothetical protein